MVGFHNVVGISHVTHTHKHTSLSIYLSIHPAQEPPFKQTEKKEEKRERGISMNQSPKNPPLSDLIPSTRKANHTSAYTSRILQPTGKEPGASSPQTKKRPRQDMNQRQINLALHWNSHSSFFLDVKFLYIFLVFVFCIF
jgi:hypothetical protein